VDGSSKAVISVAKPHKRRLIDIQIRLKRLAGDSRCHTVMLKEKDSSKLKPLHVCRKPSKCLACRAYYVQQLDKKMWQILSTERNSKFDHLIISPASTVSNDLSVTNIKKTIKLINKSRRRYYLGSKLIWAIHPPKDGLPSHAHVVTISSNVHHLKQLEDKFRSVSRQLFGGEVYVKRARSRIIGKAKGSAKLDDLVRLALYCIGRSTDPGHKSRSWALNGFEDCLDLSEVSYPMPGPRANWELAYVLKNGVWVKKVLSKGIEK